MNVLHSNVACFVQICWITYSIAKSSKCLWTSGDFCLVCNSRLILLSIWPLFPLGYLLRVFHTFWCVLWVTLRTSMNCVKFLIMLFSLKISVCRICLLNFQNFVIFVYCFYFSNTFHCKYNKNILKNLVVIFSLCWC